MTDAVETSANPQPSTSAERAYPILVLEKASLDAHGQEVMVDEILMSRIAAIGTFGDGSPALYMEDDQAVSELAGLMAEKGVQYQVFPPEPIPQQQAAEAAPTQEAKKEPIVDTGPGDITSAGKEPTVVNPAEPVAADRVAANIEEERIVDQRIEEKRVEERRIEERRPEDVQASQPVNAVADVVPGDVTEDAPGHPHVKLGFEGNFDIGRDGEDGMQLGVKAKSRTEGVGKPADRDDELVADLHIRIRVNKDGANLEFGGSAEGAQELVGALFGERMAEAGHNGRIAFNVGGTLPDLEEFLEGMSLGSVLMPGGQAVNGGVDSAQLAVIQNITETITRETTNMAAANVTSLVQPIDFRQQAALISNDNERAIA